MELQRDSQYRIWCSAMVKHANSEVIDYAFASHYFNMDTGYLVDDDGDPVFHYMHNHEIYRSEGVAHWYEVEKPLAVYLANHDEVVLECKNGFYYWGRKTSGQEFYMDGIIGDAYVSLVLE